MSHPAAALPAGTLTTDVGNWLSAVRPWRKADGAVIDADGTEWVSAAKAGEIAGVDPSSIWKAADRGEIARRRNGRNWRYKRPDVERWRDRRSRVEDRLDDHERRIVDLTSRVERLERGGDGG